MWVRNPPTSLSSVLDFSGQERHGPQLPECGALIPHLIGQSAGPMQSLFEQVFR
jgi:hypothetical protein